VRTKQSTEFLVLAVLLFANLLGLLLPPVLSGIGPQSVRVSSRPSVGGCLWSSSTIFTCAAYPTDVSFADNLLPSQAQAGNEGGGNSVIIVQDVTSAPVSKNYAFLKFDFTKVLPLALIELQAKPLNGTLWLYNLYTNSFQNANVRAYRVQSNDWNEDTLTWNNMPQPDASHYVAQQITLNNRWYNWSVTGDVQDITKNGIISFAMIPGFTSSANYAVFAAAAQSNGKGWPELDISFQVPALILHGLPNLPVLIDGRIVKADANGGLYAFLPWGMHNVSVPEALPVSDGVRMRFINWSDDVKSATRQVDISNNVTLSVNYRTQNRLDVISEYATTSGSGWYFENETAVASVEPTVVFAQGLPGLLGVRHILVNWGGGCMVSANTCSVIMDRPREVTAVWRDDYTISIVFATLIAMVLALTLILRRRKRAH
jgi:hypothetical protein